MLCAALCICSLIQDRTSLYDSHELFLDLLLKDWGVRTENPWEVCFLVEAGAEGVWSRV